MAVNSNPKKFNDPELQKIADKIDAIDQETVKPRFQEPFDPKKDNEYLQRVQKKFEAIQWREQSKIQLKCGKAKSITLDGKEYFNKAVDDIAETDIAEKYLIWERLYVSFINNSQNMIATLGDSMKIEEFKKKLIEMKKIVDDADKEQFATMALYYFGIPRETALKNKELLMPYLLGRKYLHGQGVVGSTFSDIAKGKATEVKNDLSRYVDALDIGD